MDISNPWSCCFFFLKYIFMDSFQLFKIFNAKNRYLWSLSWCYRRIFWCISVSFSGNWDWVRHLSNMGTQSWKSRKWFQVTDFSVFNRWFLINDWQSSDSLRSENPRKTRLIGQDEKYFVCIIYQVVKAVWNKVECH